MPIIQRSRDRQSALSLREVRADVGRLSQASGGAIASATSQSAQAVAGVGSAISRESNVLKQLGSRMQQEGQRQIASAIKSIQETRYNKSMGKATVEINRAVSNRTAQITDEDGEPTYQTLASDVERISNKIMSKHSLGLSGAAKARYVANLSVSIGNKVISANRSARSQHLDYSRTTLFNSIDVMSEQALADDPENLNNYTGNIKDMIITARKDGLLSATEARGLVDNARKNIRITSYNRLIQDDPNAASEVLEGNAAGLGLRESERLMLRNRAKNSVEELEADNKRAEREFVAANRETQSTNTAELDFGIIEGVTTRQAILDSLDEGEISQTQANTLLRRKDAQNGKRDRGISLTDSIQQMKETGVPDFSITPSQLDDYYGKVVASMQDEEGNPVSITQKTVVASQIPANINAYKKELSFHATRGTEENAIESLRAYQMVKVKNPIAIEGMDAKGRDILSLADFYVQHTGMTDSEAIQAARDSVLDVDEESRKLRAREFNTFDEFHVTESGDLSENLDDTIKEAFDVDGFFGVGEAEVDPEMRGAFLRVVRETYMARNTGDIDAAVASAVDKMRAVYGVSEVNGEKVLMRFPPEKVFGGTPKQIRKDLEKSVAQLPGVTKERVRIKTDYLTILDPTGAGYAMVEDRDVDGEVIAVPVENENGDYERYIPDTEGMRKTANAEIIAKARKRKADLLLTDLHETDISKLF